MDTVTLGWLVGAVLHDAKQGGGETQKELNQCPFTQVDYANWGEPTMVLKSHPSILTE